MDWLIHFPDATGPCGAYSWSYALCEGCQLLLNLVIKDKVGEAIKESDYACMYIDLVSKAAEKAILMRRGE